MKGLCFIIGIFVCAISLGQETKNEIEIKGLKLYPNPVVDGKIYVETLYNAPKTILIFDVFGTEVMGVIIEGKELNVSKLDSGAYMLRIVENNKMATRKLIIK